MLNATTSLEAPMTTSPAAAPVADRISHYQHVPRRYWGRHLSTVLIVLVLLFLANAFARGKIEWRFVGQFLTAATILKGIGNTIVMSVAAMALGVLLGVVTAIMRLSITRSSP
jgi:polar amino acid transport system permease protein